MFRPCALLFLIVLAGRGWAAEPAPETPAAAVHRFYSICREERLSGLPDARQLARLSGLLSARLAALIEAARAQQARFQREHPGEKPPFIEGDLFSSLFEGPTGFEVGAVERSGDRARASMNFSHVDTPSPGQTFRWRDDVLLVREQGQWRVDDVEYRGDWPFAARGRLTRQLEARVE